MYFEEFVVGQRFEIPPFSITKEQILGFARDYDPLPIHIDEDYAKTTRFGGLIASGVMTFMLAWTSFIKNGDPFGAELVAGASNHMEWQKPSYAGDRLHGTVSVRQLKRRNPYNGLVEFEVVIYKDDEQVASGGGEVVVKARGA
ncbi:MAG: MaoC family dehydratase N-terminal domain-containing protein [Coriobacteriales bacterium]|jgi:acyl dehydratase|nr:MaoC family dehydratase N-terminal domain-containing protein [Coriobacteriales bacterium]